MENILKKALKVGNNLFSAKEKLVADKIDTTTIAEFKEVEKPPQPSQSLPSMDGVASIGTSKRYAREDHVHPSDTCRVPVNRKINDKELTEDITLTAEDVGALSSDFKRWDCGEY